MSASYVRYKIEQWCEEAALTSGVNFHKTINTEETPQDDVFFTVEFMSLYSEGMLCKKNYLEQGMIRLVFVGQPGVGWEDTILSLESVVPEMMSKVDPSRRLELVDYEPLVEESGGSAEPNYVVSVSINYSHNL